jgi:AmmeMemoRadiSam system protein B/AmmeMemoRadiSam system protein A
MSRSKSVAVSLVLLVGLSAAQVRRPAVAGKFYPEDRTQLREMLHELFARVVHTEHRSTPLALIVPHAGYVFSGGVAASGYSLLPSDATFENVFILGPSHTVPFDGVAVSEAEAFVTPLGRVEVNREICKALRSSSSLFVRADDSQEHSIEVQLPFLQYRLQNPFRIVPLMLGGESSTMCSRLASVLRSYLTKKNLFVISTDFSHYPASQDAIRSDKACAEAILANSPEELMRVKEEFEHGGIPNLLTCMCGWTGVLTLLDMTEHRGGLHYQSIASSNSGESPLGRKDQVVGYQAIALMPLPEEGEKGWSLSPEERRTLLSFAREAIQARLTGRSVPRHDQDRLSGALRRPCGAFVTLQKDGSLRGCLGRFEATDPLYQVVQEMAVAAATQDFRFAPVTPDELKEITLEVSVLTPLRRIRSAKEIELGRDGIYIRKNGRSGTYLPQVAQETGWSREELLGHCAEDKAGLGWDGWKDAELYVYEAVVFSEREEK